jgi:hypothetical protein
MHDQGDNITDGLARLRSAGWSIGDTAFFDVERGGIVHVVIGAIGENQIRAEREAVVAAFRPAPTKTAIEPPVPPGFRTLDGRRKSWMVGDGLNACNGTMERAIPGSVTGFPDGRKWTGCDEGRVIKRPRSIVERCPATATR